MTYTRLGVDDAGNPIEVHVKDRIRHTYILGSTGYGKTVLLTNMILQDIAQGISVCIFDPLGSLLHSVLERIPQNRLDDVIYLDITSEDYPFGLNIYECDDPTKALSIERSLERVMHVWDKIFGITKETPLLRQYMSMCAQTIIANPGYTMAEIPFVLMDKAFRDKLLVNVKAQHVLLFWRHFETKSAHDRNEDVETVMRRIDEFQRSMINNIVGQSHSTINMRQLMDIPYPKPGKIILVNLTSELSENASLIGGFLLAEIVKAAYSRRDVEEKKRRPFHVYCDEFNDFATKDMYDLLTKTRQYHIALTVAHQDRSKLHEEYKQLAAGVLGASTIVCFRLIGDDAEELAGIFDTTPPDPEMEEAGRRSIKSPVSNVVEWLLSGRGSHVSPVVNRFAHGTLKKISINIPRNEESDLLTPQVNELLFDAMNGNIPEIPHDILQQMLSRLYAFDRWGPPVFVITDENEDEIRKERTQARLNTLTYELTNSAGITDWYNGYLSQNKVDNTQRFKDYTPLDITHPRDYLLALLKRDGKIIMKFMRLNWGDEDWYFCDENSISLVEWEKQTGGWFDKWIILPGQEPLFYESQRLAQTVDEEIQHSKQITQAIVTELQAVMAALADHPILADSGDEETIMRPGQQKSHAEIRNQLATSLTSLEQLRARVRVPSFPDNIESHVCQRCWTEGYIWATECLECGVPYRSEYVITVEPSSIRPMPISVRLEAIQKKNLADGYLRKREDVEEEIAQRGLNQVQPVQKPTQVNQPMSQPKKKVF